MSSTATTKGSRGKPKSTKPVSRSQKASFRFPIGRITCFLKAIKYADRVGAGAPVYLAAVTEAHIAGCEERCGINRALGHSDDCRICVPRKLGRGQMRLDLLHGNSRDLVWQLSSDDVKYPILGF